MARNKMFMAQVNAAEWGGVAYSGWGPAFAGTLNQTGRPDAEASTFGSREAAEVELEALREEFSDHPTRVVEVV
jgi:hypothetical protein